jgi:hypothetical protein
MPNLCTSRTLIARHWIVFSYFVFFTLVILLHVSNMAGPISVRGSSERRCALADCTYSARAILAHVSKTELRNCICTGTADRSGCKKIHGTFSSQPGKLGVGR